MPTASSAAPGPELLGTRLRLLLSLLDSDVASVYEDLGLAGIRPRWVPYLRTLAAQGPRSVQELAAATGVTHSAASQTVAQLVREGLATVAPGADARQRVATLTDTARGLLPALDAEWEATATAAAAFEAELSYPLSALVGEAIEALGRRPLRERIAEAAPHLIRPAG
ncbi:MarR family winged helix-turn-helix transcriptional regulator [Streptomyces sp. t39]|uniref:MarR family winged helix-turn-helix transcriptional regulator n=1 Tax=Streptomyces sp. t39 TaxID=1828156 RepID=UPI0011CD7C19|nr:helix-turn-helix domain-containing protein [Streptomyces sp. t39]TXS49206.1 MarR family transcriptional regulator [Streptomyces sp. t39]